MIGNNWKNKKKSIELFNIHCLAFMRRKYHQFSHDLDLYLTKLIQCLLFILQIATVGSGIFKMEYHVLSITANVGVSRFICYDTRNNTAAITVSNERSLEFVFFKKMVSDSDLVK